MCPRKRTVCSSFLWRARGDTLIPQPPEMTECDSGLPMPSLTFLHTFVLFADCPVISPISSRMR